MFLVKLKLIHGIFSGKQQTLYDTFPRKSSRLAQIFQTEKTTKFRLFQCLNSMKILIFKFASVFVNLPSFLILSQFHVKNIKTKGFPHSSNFNLQTNQLNNMF